MGRIATVLFWRIEMKNYKRYEIAPVRNRELRGLTAELSGLRVNSQAWLNCNDRINKFWIEEIKAVSEFKVGGR